MRLFSFLSGRPLLGLSTLLCLTLLSFPSHSFGQLKLDWAKRVGNSLQDFESQVLLDDQSNVYLAATFLGTIDLDPGPGNFNVTANNTAGNFSDIYLIKLDSNGSFIWGTSFGGSGDDFAFDFAMDPFGCLYVGGYSTASFSVGGNYVPATFNDAILVKFDPNGNSLWAKSFQSPGHSTGYSVTTDQFANVYLAGSFKNSIAFLPGNPAHTGHAVDQIDAFVVSLDSAGGLRWGETLGGQDLERAFTVEVDHLQNVYLGGDFSMTAEFDPDTNSIALVALGQNSSPDGFVCKLDSNGQYQWARQFGDSWFLQVSELAIDSLENVYAAGYFQTTAYFDPGLSAIQLTSLGSIDAFVCKLDPAGNTLKVGHMTGPDYIRIQDLLLLGPDEFYLTGNFIGSADLDLGQTTAIYSSNGVYDIFLAKYDTSLVMEYTVTTGGPIGDAGISIKRDSQGHIYLAGMMGGLSDLDFRSTSYNLQGAGGWDLFIAKYEECIPTRDTVQIGACGSIQLNGYSYNVPGSYQQRLINADGCDSILTVNFALLSTDSTLIVSGCDSVLVNGQAYHSTGIYPQVLTNANGCDSSLTIFATLLNSSATLTTSACDSLAINGQTYLTSGVYAQHLTNAAGCDSSLMINLTLQQTSDSILSLSTCDSLSLNGQTFSSSGIYTQVLTNSMGCDSVLTLDLTINALTNGSLAQSACDSLSLNGQTFSSSGIYTQILTNSVGCDSVLSLDLTINGSTNGFLSISSCDSLSLNGQTFSSSGIYTQILTNSMGCDSTLQLNVFLEPSPLATISQSGTNLIASPAGMNYQWFECENGLAPLTGETGLQFIPQATGSYAVVVSDSLCSDTSDCFSTVVTNSKPPISEIDMLVVPNPSRGKFKVLFPITLEWAHYRITDMTARVVHIGSVQSVRELIFNLDQPKGIYVLEVEHHLGTSLSRLVLQ